MILNAFSITEVFLGMLSAILMIWCGFFSFILFRKRKTRISLEQKNRIEGQTYLLLLIAVVVLIVRLLNWPFFYATLQSFISDIEGAMCIFGVTQIRPLFTKFQEILKPLVFFFIGAWLLVHKLDQDTKTSPLMGRKLLFLSLLSIMVVVDAIGDVVLIMTVKPGILVSCCTTVADILSRPTRTVPQTLLGPAYEQLLKNLYFISHLILMGFIGYFLWLKKLDTLSRSRKLFLFFTMILALINGFIFVLSQIESIAPKMMGLPYHHCLYCQWQYVPDSIIMYILFILGTFSVCWGFTTVAIGEKGEAKVHLPQYLKKLYAFSLFCLLSSLTMVIIHLLVG